MLNVEVPSKLKHYSISQVSTYSNGMQYGCLICYMISIRDVPDIEYRVTGEHINFHLFSTFNQISDTSLTTFASMTYSAIKAQQFRERFGMEEQRGVGKGRKEKGRGREGSCGREKEGQRMGENSSTYLDH